MKRIIAFTFAFFAIVGIGHAQKEPGKFSVKPMVGLSLNSRLGYNDFDGDLYEEESPSEGVNSSLRNNIETKTRGGYTFGVEVGYQLRCPMELSLGVQYSRVTMEQQTDIVSNVSVFKPISNSYAIKLSEEDKYHREKKYTHGYIQIPVLLNYYLFKGLAFKVGLQPMIRVQSECEIYRNDNKKKVASEYRKTANDMWSENKTSTVEESNPVNGLPVGDHNDIGKFDLTIPVGISYEYKNIFIDARYNFGLYRARRSEKSTRKHSFGQIMIGYRI